MCQRQPLRPLHTLWAWVPLCLLLCFPAMVWAAASESSSPVKQDLCRQVPSCAQHYSRAKELSKAGKLTQAIEEYEAAYHEVQLPVFLYNIARMNHRLGNLAPAASYYRRFIAAVVDEEPEQRTRAQEQLNQVEALLPRPTPTPAPPPSNTEVTPPPPTTAAPLLQVLDTPASPPVVPKRPVYKTWWFWTITGTAVAAIAVGVGVGVSSSGPSNSIPADIPTIALQF